MEQRRPLQSIPDDELLCRLSELLCQSRRVESDLVAHIGEVDERRLYAQKASPSMFAYCTEVLHLSEAEAYLVAELAPRPDTPAVTRKLPERRTPPMPGLPIGPNRVSGGVLQLRPDAVEASPAPAPVPPAVVRPLAPARYKVQFTASAELHNKLERLRALMRSRVPDGDLAAIIEQAVTEKLRLQYHHRHPFALGGDHSPTNICLACHAHNGYLAERDYGREAMARYRRSGNPVSEAVAVHSTGSIITPASATPAVHDPWANNTAS